MFVVDAAFLVFSLEKQRFLRFELLRALFFAGDGCDICIDNDGIEYHRLAYFSLVVSMLRIETT